MLKPCLLWVTLVGWLEINSAHAQDVRVAVAANFTAPVQKIAALFEQQTGNHVLLTFGGTGKFYAQIKNGAPFDILLAADDTTPLKLVHENLAVPGSQFTYAIGKLVLWSASVGLVDNQGKVLSSPTWQHMAVANPKLAPYGAAAMQVLDKLGLTATVQPKMASGEDIAQTYQFVASGNAQLGFVAYSQVLKDGRLSGGSMWLVPANLYTPIRQDAALLTIAKNNLAATALLTFLQRNAKAIEIIKSYGYDLRSGD